MPAELPILCRVDALDSEQRERHAELISELRSAFRGVEELDDGYAFLFPAESSVFLKLAEWITLESACCPFLDSELRFEPEGGSLMLFLRGPEGVKDFLKSELPVLRKNAQTH